jgi:hypothetical protein
MAEGSNGTRVDSWYDRLLRLISASISRFVAAIFLLFALGAFYGFIVAAKWPHLAHYLLAAPVVLAIFAYYDRTFATVVFAGMLLIFIIL